MWRKNIRSWWGRVRWILFVLLSMTTLYLGYAGFASYFKTAGQPRTFLDLVYLSLQLFTLESGSVPGPKTWPLELARLMAPSLAAYAVIQAVMAVFREQVRSARLRFFRDHVVVCGLGQKGFLLVKRFLEQGYRVSVVEKDENNPRLSQAAEAGAMIVIGDAVSRSTLLKARLHRARYVLSVCGNDGINAEVSAHAFEMAKARKGRAQRCFIHIVDPRLCQLLKGEEFIAEKAGIFELEFFNVYDSGARIVLSDYPAFNQQEIDSSAAPHIVIVGLGRMGRSLAVHAAREWRPNFGRTEKPLSITVIDKEANRKVESLLLQYPQMSKVCRLTPLQMDIRGREFKRADFIVDQGSNSSVDAAYICLDDSSSGLAAALILQQKVRKHRVPIVVRMPLDAGLATLLDKIGAGPGGFDNIRAFGLLDRTCQPELVLGGIHETIARALHRTYVREQTELGRAAAGNPSLADWDDLSDELKESNRNQAGHVGVKLAAIGCRVALLTDWDAELFSFTPEEVETLAEMEHERWMSFLLSNGWSHKKGEKSEKKRTHPHLVPWNDLGDDIKDYDRAFIRDMPRILAEVDLQIFRVRQDR